MYNYHDFEIQRLDKSNLYTEEGKNAFNPGLMIHGGQIHFAYRLDNTGAKRSEGTSDGSIVVGKLDPITIMPTGAFGQLSFALNPENYTYEDPKFFVFSDKLYMAIVVVHRTGTVIDWIRQAIVDCETNALQILQLNQARQHAEKNWTFFQYGERLMCSHSLFNGRHIVCKIDGHLAIPIFDTQFEIAKWQEGNVLRGTSNLVLRDGLLWGVAHTREVIKGKIWSVKYTALFYAINPSPPFNVEYIQKEPMIDSNNESTFIFGHNLYCIFPSALLMDGDDWIVGAGINDSYVSIMRIPHSLVLSQQKILISA